MAYLKIRCGNCGGSWEIYDRDNWNDPKARQCPHCFAEINKDIWDGNIIPGFGMLSDGNRELYKLYTGFWDSSMFTVDYHANQRWENEEGKANSV